MMCLRPKQILNPSRYVRVGSGQPLYIDVPCGCCSECIVQYRNEWRNRAYFEACSTFSNPSGFVLFDTLTYRNGCLPRLSDKYEVPKELDFPCFSRDDVTRFFKRLRRDLELDGFQVDGNLRYFLVSEYGSDIRYTKRPHYHVLFFSCVPSLTNLKLSSYISNAWCYFDSLGSRHPLGITDGFPYKSSSHVNYNTFYSSDVYRILGYVSKYVTKDFSYSSLVESRLKKISSSDKFLDNDQISDLKRLVRPFHVQSQGFGWSYLLETFPLDYFVVNGTIPVLNKDGIIQHVSLSNSLKRKLFYTYNRESDGRVVWRATENLIPYRLNRSKSSINLLASRIYSKFHDFFMSYKLAEYILFARNRLISEYSSPLDSLKSSYNVDSGLRNYATVDKKFLNKPIFTLLDFGSKRSGFCSSLVLSRASSLETCTDSQYITLDQLKQFVFDSDLELLYQKYKAALDLSADGHLAVLKLKHRLNHVHKSKVL